MLLPSIRIAFLIVFTLSALYSFFIQEYKLGGVMLLGAAWGLYGYFKKGTVALAFRSIQKNNPEKALEYLLMNKNIERLDGNSKACYHFVMGYVFLSQKKLREATDSFKLCVSIGMKSHNDRVMVLLNLTGVLLTLKQASEAKEYFRIVTDNYKIPKHLNEEYLSLQSKLKS